MTQAERDIRRKLRILKYAEESGNVDKTCRYFGISKSTFYVWEQRYAQLGEAGLINSTSTPVKCNSKIGTRRLVFKNGFCYIFSASTTPASFSHHPPQLSPGQHPSTG